MRLVALAVLIGLFTTPVLAADKPAPDPSKPPADEGFSNPIPPERNLPVPRADYEGLPADVGREETYLICFGCHSIGRIKERRLTRDEWETTLNGVAARVEQFPELDPEERETILTYLSKHFSSDLR